MQNPLAAIITLAPPRSLDELFRDVREARAHVTVMRAAPVDQNSLISARQSLLAAMEAYGAELAARKLPIPRQLHDDLRLLRELRARH